MAEIVIKEYRGWKNCFVISNGHCEVIILPETGGRVMSFSLAGQNIIYENADFDGKTYQDWQNERFDPDGGRFDVGPEQAMVKKHDLTWMGPWETEIIDDYTLKITSQPDTLLGLRTTRIFRLETGNNVLHIDQSIENISNQDIKAHFWGRTLVKPDGKLYMPLRFSGYFKNGFARFLWNPNRVVTAKEKDKRITIADDILEFHAVGKVIKAGVDAFEGWMVYVHEGLVMVKEFEVSKEKDYSASDYMTGIFFSNGIFAEMEPCSPTSILPPGKVQSFRETWKLFKHSRDFSRRDIANLIENEGL
ncbi:MAG: hypothetical protein JJU28_16260 [Cyclobacteriaceae bacterium]|nr:hypothetical protein [Cyclobacteriaceae bacterium]